MEHITADLTETQAEQLKTAERLALKPEAKLPIVTHCAACGRQFGRRTRITISHALFCGLGADWLVVHFGCRFSRLRRVHQNG
jgi:hypothetical protein